jgi:hypothetical protein
MHVPYGYVVTIGDTRIRRRANEMVSKAVREGRLTREPCERCGNEPTYGHHESYVPGDELKVNWLCPKCHAARHKELRQGMQEFENDVRRVIEQAQREQRNTAQGPTELRQQTTEGEGAPTTSTVSRAEPSRP